MAQLKLQEEVNSEKNGNSDHDGVEKNRDRTPEDIYTYPSSTISSKPPYPHNNCPPAYSPQPVEPSRTLNLDRNRPSTVS